jgi:hypothetical protein
MSDVLTKLNNYKTSDGKFLPSEAYIARIQSLAGGNYTNTNKILNLRKTQAGGGNLKYKEKYLKYKTKYLGLRAFEQSRQ